MCIKIKRDIIGINKNTKTKQSRIKRINLLKYNILFSFNHVQLKSNHCNNCQQNCQEKLFY